MSRARRRAARQAKQERISAAFARAHARQEEINNGTRKGPRVFTRKDREIVSAVGGGNKQRYKHSAKRRARRDAKRQVEWALMLESIIDRLAAGAAARPTTVGFAGSSVPYVAHGTCMTVDGTNLVWDFRYRYDRAFLEVGTPDPDDPHFVEAAVLSAWRDDVTGNPYQGWLDAGQAAALLAELFGELAPPEKGTRFAERLSNTVDLALGGGDPNAPHLIRSISDDNPAH